MSKMYIDANTYRELLKKAAAYDEAMASGVFLLSDFARTLVGILENDLTELKEPVFTNPTTGKRRPRSTLFSAL